MISSRLGRIALVFLMFVTSLGLSPAATKAQDDAPFPPNPLPSSATLNYVVDGEIDAEFAGSGRLVFERFELEVGDTMPAETGPQILINVSGTLETLDDLGLTASLKAGDRLFAPAGTIDELTAKEKSTILRARFVGPASETKQSTGPTLTITETTCDPDWLHIATGGSLQIKNETSRSQPFQVNALDIDLSVEANETVTLDLNDAKSGSWIAGCGRRGSLGTHIDSVTLVIGEPTSAADPVSTSAEVSGQTILIDAPLESISNLAATLFVAKVTLQGKSNTGEQTFDGITGVVAMSQPLSLIRPGRLPATLPVETGVALPAGTEVTIENTAVGPTEFFVVGLTHESTTDDSADADADEESDEDDEGRPTSRDDPDPTEERTPTPEPDSADAGSLESMLPGEDDLEALGFTWVNTEPMFDFDDSLFASFDDASVEASWEEGITFTYSNFGSSEVLIIAIDRFSSRSSAIDAAEVLHLGMILTGNLAPTPPARNADDAFAFEIDIVEDNISSGVIVGRFGDIVITVVVGVDLYDDGLDPALEIWELVDDAQD